MRKSVNITNSTKKLIKDIKEVKYPNDRVMDSYIINESMKKLDYVSFQSVVKKQTEEKNYQSIKYNLDIKANEILTEFMELGYKADIIIKTALENLYSEIIDEKKNEKRLELYKRRYNLFINTESRINIVGTSGIVLNMSDFLPIIYSVSISGVSDVSKKTILYVGKSKLFADREATHIISLFDEPEYFGLRESDLLTDKLIITFSIEEQIDVTKCNTMSELESILNKSERDTVNRLRPVTQCGMKMMSKEEKIIKVEKVINELLKRESKVSR